MSSFSRACEAVWLGRIDYDAGLELQERAVRERTADARLDTLFLVEHPPVVTLGRAADRHNVVASDDDLAAIGARVHHTGRGGDVTYHGPGQLVGYPVVQLKPDRCDVHRYVRDLEEVLIRVLRVYGIEGERIAGLTGVWVGGEKVAAIGVRIARWVTSHGFALNVTTDLAHFRTIVPCGISDRGVTSIERITGVRHPLSDVAAATAKEFGEVFERRITFTDAARVDQPARA